MFKNQKPQYYNDVNSPQTENRLSVIPIKILETFFFPEIDKLIVKYLWKLNAKEHPGRGAGGAGINYMLLLLLSQFSRVRLCVTPSTAARQAPPSLGFYRQEHWSGVPLTSPMRESEVAQSCPTLSDPMDHSLPGSSVHGIFQARVVE